MARQELYWEFHRVFLGGVYRYKIDYSAVAAKKQMRGQNRQYRFNYQ